MRWLYFLVLQIALIMLVVGVVNFHEDKATIVKTPPKSLSQWYKPDNKRQVWLHNMFKLRREMQAVKFYAEQQDNKHMQKWASRLNEHYLKIGQMVPEWGKKLDVSTLTQIENSVAIQDFPSVISSLDILQKNCDSCHTDYQAITALTYRAPDFSNIEIDNEKSLNAHMQKLSYQVNQIKIASEDGLPNIALAIVSSLEKEMSTLGKTCSNCHKSSDITYPNVAMNDTLSSLKTSLESGTLKEQGRYLGTLAVQACAQCHSTHRLSFGAKTLLTKDQNFSELIKH